MLSILLSNTLNCVVELVQPDGNDFVIAFALSEATEGTSKIPPLESNIVLPQGSVTKQVIIQLVV